MNPATIAIAATAINDLSQTLLQYSQGQITQEQAHTQLVAAFGNLQLAIQQFETAGKPPP